MRAPGKALLAFFSLQTIAGGSAVMLPVLQDALAERFDLSASSVGAASAALAVERDPLRPSAIAGIATLLYGAALTAAAAPSDSIGWSMLPFALLAVTTAAMAYPARHLASPKASSLHHELTGTGGRTPLLTVALVLLLIGEAGTAAFAFDLAERHRLSDGTASAFLVLGSLASVAVLVVTARRHITDSGTIVVLSTIVISMLRLLMGLPLSPLLFSVVFIAWAGLYSLCLAGYFALCALYDPTGRLAAQANAAMLLGLAVGPLALGVVLDELGMKAFGFVSGGLGLLAAGFALAVVREHRPAHVVAARPSHGAVPLEGVADTA